MHVNYNNIPDEDQAAFIEAILGNEADEWIHSAIGRYVTARAFEESEVLTVELKNCDPDDSKRVRELQNKIKACEQALIWVNEAIIAGRQSLELLEEKRL